MFQEMSACVCFFESLCTHISVVLSSCSDLGLDCTRNLTAWTTLNIFHPFSLVVLLVPDTCLEPRAEPLRLYALLTLVGEPRNDDRCLA